MTTADLPPWPPSPRGRLRRGDERARERGRDGHEPSRRPPVGHDGDRVRVGLGRAADRPRLAPLGDAARARSRRRGGFGVSILGRAAPRRRPPRLGARRVRSSSSVSSTRTPAGVKPGVAGALAHLDCDVVERVEVADHTDLLRPRPRGRGRPGGEPLVYFRRAYRTLAPHDRPPTERSTRAFRADSQDRGRRPPRRARRDARRASSAPAPPSTTATAAIPSRASPPSSGAATSPRRSPSSSAGSASPRPTTSSSRRPGSRAATRPSRSA